jgi:hypothetical protein
MLTGSSDAAGQPAEIGWKKREKNLAGGLLTSSLPHTSFKKSRPVHL